MHKKILISMLAVILGLSLCLPELFAQEVVNRVLAVVNDEVITSQDLNKMIARLDTAFKPAATEEERVEREKSLRKLALDTLIEERLILKEADRQGMTVSDRDVDAYINRIKTDNNLNEQAFNAQLSRQGLSLDEYRDGLRKDLLKRRLIAREISTQVVISDDQVMDYMKEQGQGPVESDNVIIRAVFLSIPDSAQPEAVEVLKKKAESLRAEAIEKKNMAELADKNSQGPGAGQGGKLGPLSVVDLAPPMRQALIGLQPGEFSPVVEMPGSILFMQLLERTHTTSEVSQSEAAQVRSKLEDEARKRKLQEWLEELKRNTYIKIMPDA